MNQSLRLDLWVGVLEDDEDDESLIILATLVFYHFMYSDDDCDANEYPLSRAISIVSEYQTIKTSKIENDKFKDMAP